MLFWALTATGFATALKGLRRCNAIVDGSLMVLAQNNPAWVSLVVLAQSCLKLYGRHAPYTGTFCGSSLQTSPLHSGRHKIRPPERDCTWTFDLPRLHQSLSHRFFTSKRFEFVCARRGITHGGTGPQGMETPLLQTFCGEKGREKQQKSHRWTGNSTRLVLSVEWVYTYFVHHFGNARTQGWHCAHFVRLDVGVLSWVKHQQQ